MNEKENTSLEKKKGKWKEIFITVVGVATFFGFKFYNKHSTKEQIKEQVALLCENEEQCLSALNQYFESCFGENFKMGGRRRSSSFDTESFIKCFNSSSGIEYLSYSSEEE